MTEQKPDHMTFSEPHANVNEMVEATDPELAAEVRELAELQRKAAAFDAMIQHAISVIELPMGFRAFDEYGHCRTDCMATAVEAVEAAVKEIEKS